MFVGESNPCAEQMKTMSGLGFQIQSQKTSVRQALVELAVTARAVGRKELQEEIKTLLDVPRPEPRY